MHYDSAHELLLTIYINSLARCELFLTIAMLFTPGQYKLRLFETNVTDVEPWHDFFNPAPKTGSKGIRVMVE